MTKNINWVETNIDILRDAAIFYIDLLIRKLNGEDIALVRSLSDYLNEHIDDIIFSDDVPHIITLSTVNGLLHPTGSFMRIGLDLRYAITWKDMPTLQAINELNILKSKIIGNLF